MHFTNATNALLHLGELSQQVASPLVKPDNDTMTIIWCRSGSIELIVDQVPVTLQQDEVTFFTGLHHVKIQSGKDARIIQFNRSFYCILNHDEEVGCKGILFYGAKHIPAISIPEEDKEKFDLLWRMFVMEMKVHDNIQEEMLRMMLKRFIILCTRLAKNQHQLTQFANGQVTLIRDFNFLVETHFRKKHTVKEYAELLHKSPKTLANLFNRYIQKSPLQIIHDRIALEAKRLILYTDYSIKEIGYQLGFDDLQSFSRFFKNVVGESPLEFRESVKAALVSGKN